MGVTLICGRVQAGPAYDEPSLKKAQELEGKRQFRDAAPIYDALLAKQPNSAELREGRQRCLRHIMQERRHRERAFRDAVLSLKKSGQVLDVYVKVLHIL